MLKILLLLWLGVFQLNGEDDKNPDTLTNISWYKIGFLKVPQMRPKKHGGEEGGGQGPWEKIQRETDFFRDGFPCLSPPIEPCYPKLIRTPSMSNHINF